MTKGPVDIIIELDDPDDEGRPTVYGATAGVRVLFVRRKPGEEGFCDFEPMRYNFVTYINSEHEGNGNSFMGYSFTDWIGRVRSAETPAK